MLQFRHFPPHPALTGIVRDYWLLEAGSSPASLDLVPDGYPECFFSLEHRILFRMAAGDWQRFPAAGMIGQLTGTFSIEVPAFCRLLSVKLYPWAAQALFGQPAWELNNLAPELEALAPCRELRTLADRIGTEPGFEKMRLLLDQFFLNKLRSKPEMAGNPFLRFSVQKIFGSQGTLPLDGLTGKTQASRRYLEKQFKTHIGLSPKLYARVIRVKKASICLLDPAYRGNLATIAASLDYFDQSHFLKDFKAIVGKSPTAFLAGASFPLNNVEDYLGQWDYS
jgi:AraC-like DNA-binding protein